MTAEHTFIVTADDYGLSPKFNEGILEAASNKLITSISMMVDRDYLNPSITYDFRSN